jgi:hypothetical protein
MNPMLRKQDVLSKLVSIKQYIDTDSYVPADSVSLLKLVHDIYFDLTRWPGKRKVKENRDQLTPFSAPSGPARSSEAHSSTTNKFRVSSLAVSLPLLGVR